MAGPKGLFEQALVAEGITGQLADVARSIYKQESGSGTNTKTSNAGARGGMQILPGTFNEVADKGWNIDDPLLNARAGIRYLKKLDKMSGGVPELTAAGYYGGPGGMAKAKKGIAVGDPRNPKAPTTLEYGRQVASRLPGAGKRPVVPALQSIEPTPTVTAQAPVSAQPEPMAQLPAESVPQPVAAAEPMADPWNAFLDRFRGNQQAPVAPKDLQYGAAPTGMQVQVPDFLAAVQGGQAQRPNFQSFNQWGARI